ncbi:MAG: hypothetical protein D6675_12820 [Gemmatimonadetes bacterium]|nr:MAG: hypothetical protein D6675_12820 [Gemmatimonadota bacterium]
MGVIRQILGAKSKYDKTLPYTYEGRVYTIEGDDDVFESYFADTVCGLVEQLALDEVDPDSVKILEIYRGQERTIDVKYCTDRNNRWLPRPEICESLRGHFKGHIDPSCCAFRDRNRQAEGPY